MLTLVFTNNIVDPVCMEAGALCNPIPKNLNINKTLIYDKVKDYVVDLRRVSDHMENPHYRTHAFDELARFAESHDSVYFQWDNYNATVDRFPNSKIMLLEYHPSLVFAKYLATGSCIGEDIVEEYMNTYCQLKMYLDANKIKYLLFKTDVELPTDIDIKTIKKVDIMNNDVLNVPDSIWVPHRKIDVFSYLGYKPLSAREIVDKFSGT